MSLTSLIGKACETVIRDAILNHLERYRLIVDSQYGFRKGGSCLGNLLQFLDAVIPAALTTSVLMLCI